MYNKMVNKNVYDKLLQVQSVLKVPKNQWNGFAKFHYRSCEDILESAKPVCIKHRLLLTTDNKIISHGDVMNSRVFVRSTARVTCIDTEKHYEVSACAEIPVNKKGMDSSQLSGSAQSYSKKYALSGLFSLDDVKDSDSEELSVPVDQPPLKDYTDEVHLNIIDYISKNGYTKILKDRLSEYDIPDVYKQAINESVKKFKNVQKR